MMKLIVETDLGHDPDDFFAICWLVAAGVQIRMLTIVPGNPDQVAVARLLCQRLGLDIPVGASKWQSGKRSSGGMHHRLVERHGLSLEGQPDGLGHDLVAEVLGRSAGELEQRQRAHPGVHQDRSIVRVRTELDVAAPAGSPQAVEFQINVYTPNQQDWPDVGVDANGNFVVTWLSFPQGGVFARRFDAANVPRGGEFQVDTYGAGYQTFPAVSVRPDGRFVVAWQSSLQDSSLYGIFVRSFDAEGTPTGPEVQANARARRGKTSVRTPVRRDGSFSPGELTLTRRPGRASA